MRWEDERYVRVYTRDTAEWLALGWEGQALLLLLLRKADRAGIIQTGKAGVRGVAALAGMPLEVVQRVLPVLLDDGFVSSIPGGYCITDAHSSAGIPEPVPVPRFQIRLKTPEERAQAEAEHARLVEANRQRGERERAHREEMKAAKRAAARVYFIQQDGGDRLVKIGTTTRPVEVRIKELQAGQPHPLVILAHAPGGRYEEGRLHDRFGPHCVTGEWFRPAAELLAYAANVGKAGVL